MSARSTVVPTLEVAGPSLPARLIPLEGNLVRIGRDPTSQIPLPFKQVSWNHARILRNPGGGYAIEDLGSYNSTSLDGRSLTPKLAVPLADRSQIRICDILLTFRSQAVSIQEQRGEATTILGSLQDLSSLTLPLGQDRASTILRAVLAINRVLGATTDLGVVLSRALDELVNIFPQTDRGFILMSEPDGKLSPRAARYSQNAPHSLNLSRTVLDHVLREGNALLITDAAEVSDSISTESLVCKGIHTAICVPVLGRQATPIGIIQLDARVQGVAFSQEDLELLAAVAIPIGVVIENHRLLIDRAGLVAAAEVQSKLLPKHRPLIPDYSFWERYQPALEVGGDYYDYIPVESEPEWDDDEEHEQDPDASPRFQGNWAVAVGDVAGKGMPAALLMANLCAEVRHLVRSGTTAVEVVARVNRQIHDAAPPGRFITFVMVILDPRAHAISVVNAGHMAPLIRRKGGSIEAIGDEEADIPLGIERHRVYHHATTSLEPGDVVILYTDGINEALGRSDSQFGKARLQKAIASAEGGPAQVGDAILRALRAHVGVRPQSDDIALVCFGRD